MLFRVDKRYSRFYNAIPTRIGRKEYFPRSCRASGSRATTHSLRLMEEAIRKARVLIEALPYIQSFRDRIIVIKFGGSAMEDESILDSVLQDIVFMSAVGMRPVVVHGGGPLISEEMSRKGKQPKFVRGHRVTDAETMEIVADVLSSINRDIVGRIEARGGRAESFADARQGLLRARKKAPVEDTASGPIDLGFVGTVEAIDAESLIRLSAERVVPVLAPLGCGPDGETLNINADVAASFVAGALKAVKVVFLSDVHGIMTDPGDEDSLVPTLAEDEVNDLIERGAIQGGMLPKVEACLAALDAGVGKAHIIDGRISHSILLEIFTKQGVGTQILR